MSKRSGGISPGPSSAILNLRPEQVGSRPIRTSWDSEPRTSQSPGEESAEEEELAGGDPEIAKVRAWTSEVSSWMACEEGSLMQVAGEPRSSSGSTSSPNNRRRTRMRWWGAMGKVQVPQRGNSKEKSTNQTNQTTGKKDRDNRAATVQGTGQRPRKLTKHTTFTFTFIACTMCTRHGCCGALPLSLCRLSHKAKLKNVLQPFECKDGHQNWHHVHKNDEKWEPNQEKVRQTLAYLRGGTCETKITSSSSSSLSLLATKKTVKVKVKYVRTYVRTYVRR